MREIKFRGKDFNGKWIIGYFTYLKDVAKIINTSGVFDVLSDTVGQYTGLHDSNGKEVYEGDILKLLTDDIFVKIVWDKKVAGYLYKNGNDGIMVVYNGEIGDNYIIAGNIYDNPELIGGKYKSNSNH